MRDAKAVPGVLDIFTHENTKGLKKSRFLGRRRRRRHVHADSGRKSVTTDRSSAWWSPIRSRPRARRPIEPRFTYAAEKPSATFDSPGVTEEDASKANERAKDLPQAGDAEAAMSSAEVKLDVEYGTPTQHHNPIELFTTTCVWRDGELTVYEPSQFVFGLKNSVAQKLGISRRTRCVS